MLEALRAMTWDQWTLCAVMLACIAVAGLGVRYGLFAYNVRELEELDEIRRTLARLAQPPAD
jgi:hypothetical protein